MAGFRKAIKHESKLRMALAGPAGSGKTFTALTIACALADGAPVAVIDTERGSASKYADLFQFDVLELECFDPRKYVEAIHDAEAAGYAVLVIDSLSHAWNGTGGLLEIVESIAKRNKGGNTFAAWADATPIQNELINAITGASLHIIATMRSKQEHVQEKDDKTGRNVVRKLGMAPVQRDGMEYEFDVFADLDQDNTLIVNKSRCPDLAGAVIAKPGAGIARTLRPWLAGASASVPASTSGAPAPQETDPPPNPAFEALHLRAKTALEAVGRKLSIEDWQNTCLQFGGAIKSQDMTTHGKNELVAHIVGLEKAAAKHKAAQQAAQATKRATAPAEQDAGYFPAEPGDGGPALATMPTGTRPN